MLAKEEAVEVGPPRRGQRRDLRVLPRQRGPDLVQDGLVLRRILLALQGAREGPSEGALVHARHEGVGARLVVLATRKDPEVAVAVELLVSDGVAEAAGLFELRGASPTAAEREDRGGVRLRDISGRLHVARAVVPLRDGGHLFKALRCQVQVAVVLQIRDGAGVTTIEHASEFDSVRQAVVQVRVDLGVQNDVLGPRLVAVERANALAHAAGFRAGAVHHLRAVAAVGKEERVAFPGAIHQPLHALDDARLVRPILAGLVLR
mmetsp:Transcript_19477/g.55814  ORF Transcript_19477/g.55814 Transcript_19477/m.55814 type:complete len:263 (+) Transcript_19477:290-1078(+)